MIKVAETPEIEGAAIEKIIHRNLARKGLIRKQVQEIVRSQAMIWMPYYEITYQFTMDKSEPDIEEVTGSETTALNAMFSAHVEEEDELLALFRPDLLDLNLDDYIPRSDEVVGPVNEIDSQDLLDKLLRYRTEIHEDFLDTGYELRQLHRRMQSMSFFLPTSKNTRMREDELAKRLAKLTGTKFSLQVRLKLPENATITEVTNTDIFYCPQLVVSLEHQLTGETRFIFIDFLRLNRKTKGGSLDDALSRLCSQNEACRATLEAAINE
jgi:hypothetical protein